MRAMDDAAVKVADSPRRRRLGTVPARRLLSNAERLGYWLVVAPLAARLPARPAYRVGCWWGDWSYRRWAGKRAEIVRNLRLVLGDELGPEEADRLARESMRFMSCEAIDVMRLRGRARSLAKLVEIRGREHLDAALAGGKGAILCSAHFGSHASAFSLLNASGAPVTSIGRWYWRFAPGMSSAERRFWDLVYARRVVRHRQRPNIEPWPGRVQVAVQAAAALRDNEVVTICSDAEPLDADRARAVEVPLLGRQARLLPGVVTLARLTGAPVLMAFVYRSADYRHQVLEISPPVPVQGEMATAFGRCVAAIDAAIRRSPAHWFYWLQTDDLVSLGLLPAAPPTGSAASQEPAVGEPAVLIEDRRSSSDHQGGQHGRREGHGSGVAGPDDQADPEERRSPGMAVTYGGAGRGREGE